MVGLSFFKVTCLSAFIAVTLFVTLHARPAASEGVALTSLSSGYAHTCAVSATAGVWCWGSNGVGELGIGTTSYTPGAVRVYGIDGAAVSAGAHHTCMVTTVGSVKCWGRNDEGQLGDGSTSLSRLDPVDVWLLNQGVVGIAEGGDHTCALKENGTVLCWGDNEYGQLGDGTTTNRLVPTQVVGLSDVSAITAGYYHTCALTTSGAAKCWGENEDGQLGIGAIDYQPHPSPADVVGLQADVAAIATGSFANHTCALTSAGGATCWGENSFGQLGNGDRGEGIAVPGHVSGLTAGVTALAANGRHSCALLDTSGVKCWGDNSYSQLGNGIRFGSLRTRPVDVCNVYNAAVQQCTETLSGVGAIAAAGFHTCAVPATGGAECWGTCVVNQLGSVPCQEAETPASVAFDGKDFTGLHDRDTDGLYDTYEQSKPCLDWTVVDAALDPDADGLSNLGELNARSEPCIADTDRDGCVDGREVGTDRSLGGRRSPLNFWDFMDVPTGAARTRDRVISTADIAAEAARFGATDAGPGPFVRTSDPLSTPSATVQPSGARANYHPAYDRSLDGAITIDDIALVVQQFGDSCA
ncbi:MAG: flexitail domain-containing putative surface protein [Dehalococcoidia bacterium]